MTTFDPAPLFRSAIGFDRLSRLVDSARAASEGPAYPPYNIEKTGDDDYVLTMAVAGFGPENLEITAHENVLTISGKADQTASDQERRFLHRGIAGRAFERRFVLADHIQVQGADMANGLLHVSLKREVPEALKPRRITIGDSQPAARQVIEGNGQQALAA
ncbi:Hsp20 family protein [Roseomonas marmotae]|uniref:Hsp20 family protein n=1 Tax=Roseomonas marmotae TaxID=2768161 RepID=A0ABS3K8H3_9PROT|nr:Hsp20 family protein [Roseomonas marmotae]MBO1073768.1 Hsp20 family protein [Roseomonas marmotae]QTI80975.1 Hsp20 family protein [Roseomonas marmotae]